MAKEKERICANCHNKVVYGYGTKPSVCPYCQNPWWDKPKDEFNLFVLQDKYIKSGRSAQKLSDMYEGLINYSENLIKKNLKGKTQIDYERIREQAEDTALNFIEVYLKKDNYIVENSFGGLLARYVAGVMYNKKQKLNDKMTSLDKTISEDMKFEDNVLRFMETSPDKEKFESDAYTEYIKNNQEELIDDLFSIIKNKQQSVFDSMSKVESFLFLIAIRNFLLKNKKCSIDEFYDYYGDDFKFEIDDCLELIKRRLKNAR